MSLPITRKHIWTIIGILMVLILTFFLSYFYLLSPKYQKVNQLENELNTNQTLATTLENQLSQESEKIILSTTELQKRVPVDPLLEQFILDIEKAEVISNSFISSMSFSEGDFGEENNNQEETSEEIVQQAPSGLKKLTVNLSVESPSYENMEKFLQTIENLKRITQIDSLSFTGEQEITSFEEGLGEINYSVTLSTFYQSKLKELRDEVPPFDKVKPSEKENPLFQGEYVTENKEGVFFFQDEIAKSSVNKKMEAEPNNAQETPLNEEMKQDSPSEKTNTKIIQHKVQKGETLYRIAMKYYHSKEGIEIIQNENQLDSNTIYVGQVLKIPLTED